MKKHALSVLGYIAATFVTQAVSHFLLFKDHYGAVSWIKAEPIFALGFASMTIQGVVMSVVYSNSRLRAGGIFNAVKLSWLFGAFLISYIGLGEAAKYAIPSVPSWIGVEVLSGAIQFTLAGAALSWAHSDAGRLSTVR